MKTVKSILIAAALISASVVSTLSAQQQAQPAQKHEFKVAIGDSVMIKRECQKYCTGETPSTWVWDKVHTVRQLGTKKFPDGVLLMNIYSWMCEECLIPVNGRAEEAARSRLRETMDIAVARAVAPMNVLCEYLLPFVRIGGYALCWKGPGLFDEKKAGCAAAAILGSAEDILLRLPIENREHYVQAYLKQTVTDARYPRRAGKPLKAPLGE